MPDLLPRCPMTDREIYAQVIFLNQTWKHQLDASHGRDERFVLSAPFEKGFQVLQEFYRGKLPTTFTNIFALMHVIYACARHYHGEDETSFWHRLFVDVLRWGHSIATLEDSILFSHVALELWAVPEYSTAELDMCSDDFASQSSLSHYQQSTPQAISGCEEMDMNQLRDVLREGEGIRVCTNYFDGSPVEIAPPMSSTSSVCPICKEPFRAKKDRDQQTSLRRHKATKHAPKRKLYPCHVPGCGKTYPRSDNLKRHLRNNHKDDVDLPDACGESLAKTNKTADI
ncbi:hypothetical protein MMC07_004922 [Pseudocyphellaria aurata]|nr:hypothetical protein [Pseudocyphellaria aurata]